MDEKRRLWLVLFSKSPFLLVVALHKVGVPFHRSRPPSAHNVFIDGLTLAVLRGFQGIGGAATIPSAVCSPESSLLQEHSPTFPARYPSTCLPTFKSTFNSIRYFCSGCSCRRCIWHDYWRCPHSTHLVRYASANPLLYFSRCHADHIGALYFIWLQQPQV
jgi:hypothetical protein